MITRDAKIGLLVVLAFCLIVGILLSEHATSSGEPKQAQLAMAGAKVRQGTNAPTPTPPANTGKAPIIDADPQPAGPVVTRDVLDAPPAPVTANQIELGKPAGGEMKVIKVEGAGGEAVAGPVQVSAPAAAQADTTPAKASDVVATTQTPAAKPASKSLAELARQQGLELVAVAPNTSTSPKVAPMSADAKLPEAKPAADAKPLPAATASKNVKTKEYVAQGGDTLSKIAGRLLGANTPANRQMIVDLNPSLQKNPEKILVGAKYLLPADNWSTALGVASADVKPADVKAPAAKAADAKSPADAKLVADAKPAGKPTEAAKAMDTKAAAKPAVATVAYEVKPGDSLWKLAAGDLGAVEQIKTLNADVLKGSESVKVGMKLKLPAKKA